MIRKITDPKTYLLVLNDLESLFKNEIEQFGHSLKVSKKVLSQYADKNLLTWTWHVWAHEQNNKNDGLIIFSGADSPLFEEKLAVEVLWLSKNPKKGLTLLKTALSWLKANGYTHIMMGRVENYPKSERLTKIYARLGFTKDGETFIGKL